MHLLTCVILCWEFRFRFTMVDAAYSVAKYYVDVGQ